MISSCFSDEDFSPEQKFILGLFKGTTDDAHPDAHACRLALTLVCAASMGGMPQPAPWKAEREYEGYLRKYCHVATACRLTVAEEMRLMRTVSDPTGLRKKYLTAVNEASDEKVEGLV